MQKITPYLWFDDRLEEALNFYTSVFNNAHIGAVNRMGGAGEEGAVLTATFTIEGQDFLALNGGPQFKFNPSISFFVNCTSEAEVDALYQALSEGGMTLMELQEYPFSKKYAWVQDQYGLSWQLMLASRAQKITPCLLFTRDQHGKAEEAIRFYTSLFQPSSIEALDHNDPYTGDSDDRLVHGLFTLHGQEFVAMDGGVDHGFTFNEAISLFVECETQAEVDRMWDQLSAGGEIQQCGWLKDRYGVSWQIIPTALGELMGDPDPAKAQSVMQAMLQMKKIEIEGLRRAYEAVH